MERVQRSLLAERASSDPQAVVKEMRNGEVIVAVTWVFTSFSIVIVILRLAVRKKFVGKLLWDDWLMLPAIVRLLVPTPLGLARYKDTALTVVL